MSRPMAQGKKTPVGRRARRSLTSTCETRLLTRTLLINLLSTKAKKATHGWQQDTLSLPSKGTKTSAVNRRGIFTPDRRALETPLIDGVERVGDRSCVA